MVGTASRIRITLGVIAMLFVLGLLACDSAVASSQDPCRNAMPTSLARELHHRFPEWRHLTLRDLDGYEELFMRDHKNKCPGIAKADFFADARPVYAVVLFRGQEEVTNGFLLMARRVDNRRWEITELMRDACPCPVVAAPMGQYRNVYGEKTIESKGEVFIHFQYEAWAIVFAWTGKAIEQTHIRD